MYEGAVQNLVTGDRVRSYAGPAEIELLLCITRVAKESILDNGRKHRVFATEMLVRLMLLDEPFDAPLIDLVFQTGRQLQLLSTVCQLPQLARARNDFLVVPRHAFTFPAGLDSPLLSESAREDDLTQAAAFTFFKEACRTGRGEMSFWRQVLTTDRVPLIIGEAAAALNEAICNSPEQVGRFEWMVGPLIEYTSEKYDVAFLRDVVGLVVVMRHRMREDELDQLAKVIREHAPEDEALFDIVQAGMTGTVVIMRNCPVYLENEQFVALALAAYPGRLEALLERFVVLGRFSQHNRQQLRASGLDVVVLKMMIGGESVAFRRVVLPKVQNKGTVEELFRLMVPYDATGESAELVLKALGKYYGTVERVLEESFTRPRTMSIGTFGGAEVARNVGAELFEGSFSLSVFVVPDSPLLAYTNVQVNIVSFWAGATRLSLQLSGGNVNLVYDLNRLRMTVQVMSKLEANRGSRLGLIFKNDREPTGGLSIYKDRELQHDAEFSKIKFEGLVSVTIGGFVKEGKEGPFQEGVEMAQVGEVVVATGDRSFTPRETFAPVSTAGPFHESLLAVLSNTESISEIARQIGEEEDVCGERFNGLVSIMTMLLARTGRIRDLRIADRLSEALKKKQNITLGLYLKMVQVFRAIADCEFKRRWFEQLVMNVGLWSRQAELLEVIGQHWSAYMSTEFREMVEGKSYIRNIFDFVCGRCVDEKSSFRRCRDILVKVMKGLPMATAEDVDHMMKVVSEHRFVLEIIRAQSVEARGMPGSVLRGRDYFGNLLEVLEKEPIEVLKTMHELSRIGTIALHDRVGAIVNRLRGKVTKELAQLVKQEMEEYPDLISVVSGLVLELKDEGERREMIKDWKWVDFESCDRRGQWFVYPLLLAVNCGDREFEEEMERRLARAMRDEQELNFMMFVVMRLADEEARDPVLNIALDSKQRCAARNLAFTVFFRRGAHTHNPALAQLLVGQYGPEALPKGVKVSKESGEKVKMPRTVEELMKMAMEEKPLERDYGYELRCEWKADEAENTRRQALREAQSIAQLAHSEAIDAGVRVVLEWLFREEGRTGKEMADAVKAQEQVERVTTGLKQEFIRDIGNAIEIIVGRMRKAAGAPIKKVELKDDVQTAKAKGKEYSSLAMLGGRRVIKSSHRVHNEGVRGMPLGRGRGIEVEANGVKAQVRVEGKAIVVKKEDRPGEVFELRDIVVLQECKFEDGSVGVVMLRRDGKREILRGLELGRLEMKGIEAREEDRVEQGMQQQGILGSGFGSFELREGIEAVCGAVTRQREIELGLTKSKRVVRLTSDGRKKVSEREAGTRGMSGVRDGVVMQAMAAGRVGDFVYARTERVVFRGEGVLHRTRSRIRCLGAAVEAPVYAVGTERGVELVTSRGRVLKELEGVVAERIVGSGVHFAMKTVEGKVMVTDVNGEEVQYSNSNPQRKWRAGYGLREDEEAVALVGREGRELVLVMRSGEERVIGEGFKEEAVGLGYEESTGTVVWMGRRGVEVRQVDLPTLAAAKPN